MTSPSPLAKAGLPADRPLRFFFRTLASLKLAVVLIVVLAGVLAWATVLESGKGREYAQWYVYKSPWFVGLLFLLAANILAATLVRFPWTKSRRGFLTTHAGLLVLFGGAILSFLYGIDGQLVFEEGQTANSILISDQCQLTVFHEDSLDRFPLAFTFRPGPSDWQPGKTLDLGELDGVHLRVLRFLRHARIDERWIADKTNDGGPAIRFALAGPDGKTVLNDWLGGGPFGGEFSIGPARFLLNQAKSASMLEDFLKPPGKDMDKQGVLSMHYQGRMYRIPVSANVGKKVPVGESKLSVEIVKYLANAQPDEQAQFTSQGDQPDNPMLELRVYLPDAKEPARQIAFAKHPLLNLDGMHGWNSPVKFWYHHPAIKPEPGVEFLQTPDGKLYCRTADQGSYQARGEVKPGDTIKMAAQFQVTLAEYLPHARKDVRFRSVEPDSDGGGPEAAAQVELAVGKSRQQFWLKRNDETYGFHQVVTPRGRLAIGMGYERLPLGFSLKLLDFQRSTNPGAMGNASFASAVELIDPHQKIDRKHTISMNEPLVHGRFTFYQSGFQELPGGSEASTLTVAYDPGRFLKYLGSLMICWGTFLMFFCRNLSFARLRHLLFPRRGSEDQATPKKDRRAGHTLERDMVGSGGKTD